MKRNGFTLVELLVVVAIIGLLIIIVATNGFGIFNKTKESINKVEENNLLDAAKTFLVEIDNEIYDKDSSYLADYPNLYDKDAYTNSEGYEVPVTYIIKYYMNSDVVHCDGKDTNNQDILLVLKIETDVNGNTIGYSAKKLHEDDIICSN